ncbi:MAG TPA: hypothetical protein DCQ83_03400 [Fibrobacteres bacterium]|nr:hypothetical protein [Fibrobacterota bacterium]
MDSKRFSFARNGGKMKKFTPLFFLAMAACSLNKQDPSWKLYKDSTISSELFLVLDMRYFGKTIQQEECERLKEFYSSINQERKFYCMLNDASPPDAPLKNTR